MTHHLVILKRDYLNRILRGHKTVECRFSRTRRPPFGAVAIGDVLWLKQSGGPIKATTTVRRVEFLHPVAQTVLRQTRRHYGESLQADQTFFENHRQANYATFIQLGDVRHIEPFQVAKNDRHAWVVLAKPPVPYL